MKKCIVVCVMLLMVSGCLESIALIGGGAAGGVTISQKLEQQRQIIRDDIVMMEAEKAELEQQLTETKDETEKQKIQLQIKNHDTVLADLRDADEVLEKAQAGLNVNWQDPQSVIPFAGAALMTAYGIWQRRKKKDAESAFGHSQLKYQAHKQGVVRTMKEVSASTNANVKAVETQLYENIGEARADLGV